MESSFRTVRIVHVALLAAALIYAFLPEMAHVQTKNVNPVFVYIIYVVAISEAVIALVVRDRLVNRAAEQLVNMPTDSTALARWRMGNILIFALSEAIVLYGLVLRFVGASAVHAGVLYAGGIMLLLIFTPKMPG